MEIVLGSISIYAGRLARKGLWSNCGKSGTRREES